MSKKIFVPLFEWSKPIYIDDIKNRRFNLLKENEVEMSGYHQTEIPRGVFGEFSKVEEEIAELLDAHQQNAKVMELCEMADLIGAMEAYINNKYNLTLEDLLKMYQLTKRAFEDGTRQSR